MKIIQTSVFCLIISFILLLTIVPLDIGASDDNSRSDESGNSTRSLADNFWPSFKGDAARTGVTKAPGLGYYNLAWSKNVGVYWSSPVMAYDQIYVPTSSQLRCYDLDGNLKWNFNAGSLYTTPLVFNGRVYYVADNGNLYALSANGTGTPTTYWTYSSGTGSHSSPTTDGIRVYYPTMGASGLHAVNINNGTKAWNATLGGSTTTEASAAYWNGRLFTGAGNTYNSGSTYMYSFYANNGTMIWRYNAGSPITSTPAVEYGKVYFGTYAGRLICVDAIGSGGATTRIWEYNTGQINGGILGSPAVGFGTTYFGALNSHLYAINANSSGVNPTPIWDKTLGPAGQFGIYSSPTINSKYVFVGTSGNGFHCRDRTTGNEVWSETFSGETYGICISAAVYKNYIAFTSDNFNLYLLEPDLVSPKITSTDPLKDATNVFIGTNITVKFDKEMEKSTLRTSSITLEDPLSNPVAGTVTSDMSAGELKVYFTPRGNSLDGNGNGVAEGVGVDEYSFSFTTVPNEKPVFNAIPLQYLVEDVPFTINLTTYISDDDTPDEELEFTHSCTYGELVGFDLTLTYPEGVLSDLFNITVTDGIFTVSRDVSVEITSVNDYPKVAPIVPLQLTEDIPYELDLKDYVTDVDTVYADLRVTDNSKYVEVDGMMLTFLYPEGVVADEVNVSIRDASIYAYADISVSIEPVNDAPVFEDIKDVYVNEDEEFDLSVVDYISDEDNEADELSIIVDSPYVTVKGFKLVMLYPDTVTEDELTVQVFDGELYDEIVLTVFVEPVNDPPEIISIDNPKEGETMEYNQSIDFSAMVTDPDLKNGDTLTFQWIVDQFKEIGTTQNVTGVVLEPGIHTVKLVVTDFEGTSVEASVSIAVKSKPVVDDTDPKGDEKDTTAGSTPDDKSSNSFAFIILGMAVAVVIVLIVVFMLVKRKKKIEDQEAQVLQEPAMPSAYQQMPAGGQMSYPQQMPAYPAQAQFPGEYPAQQVPQMGYPGQTDMTAGDQYQMQQPQYPQLPYPGQVQDQDQYQDPAYGDQNEYMGAGDQDGQTVDQPQYDDPAGSVLQFEDVPDQVQEGSETPVYTPEHIPGEDQGLFSFDEPQMEGQVKEKKSKSGDDSESNGF
jgi:outer membrane protein assembly factor BamB/cell division protein FtsN